MSSHNTRILENHTVMTRSEIIIIDTFEKINTDYQSIKAQYLECINAYETFKKIEATLYTI